MAVVAVERSAPGGRHPRPSSRASCSGYRREDLALAGRRTDLDPVLLGPDRPGRAGASGRSTPQAIDVVGGRLRARSSRCAVSGVRREGTVVLDDVDWWCTGRALGHPGAQRIGEDHVADLGRRPSVALGSGSVEILGARLGRVDVRTLRPRISLVSGSVTRQLRADLPARDVVVSGRPRRTGDLVEHVYGRRTGPRRTAFWARPASPPSRAGPSG